jgi:hypothetical protein
MPASIQSMPFSFIRLNDPDFSIILPSTGQLREAFQFKVIGDMPATDKIFLAIKEERTGTTIMPFLSGAPEAQVLTVDGINWDIGFMDVPADPLPPPLSTGDYFRYVLRDASDVQLAESNLFQIVDEALFTSVISYRCNSSAFGFQYSSCDTDVINRVRLPFYLNKPSYPKKRTVYRKSNGVNRLLSALVEKEYNLLTEQLPELFHECMAIALSHEDITVECTNTREGTLKILEAEDYKAGWPEDEDIDFAQGTCKVKVATFGYTANNCAGDGCPCTKVFVVLPVVLPDGDVGAPYELIFTLGGSAPFTFVDEGLPAWMTHDITGNVVTLGGTPDDAGTFNISFSIENCGGNDNFINVNQDITIS